MAHQIYKPFLMEDRIETNCIYSQRGAVNKTFSIEIDIVSLESQYVVFNEEENIYRGRDLDLAIEKYNQIKAHGEE